MHAQLRWKGYIGKLYLNLTSLNPPLQLCHADAPNGDEPAAHGCFLDCSCQGQAGCAHVYMVLAKPWSSISVALHSVLFLVSTVRR